jgi:quaternary ammonium compound-resistance protein SugE
MVFMAWFYLFLAGLFEVFWAVGMKYSEGFSKLYPSLFTITFMVLSVIFLAWSVKTLPLGTAYAVWTGIGAFGTVIYGIVFFSEPASLLRLLCLALIILAIMGLKLSHSS